jgi:hypothetical protein
LDEFVGLRDQEVTGKLGKLGKLEENRKKSRKLGKLQKISRKSREFETNQGSLESEASLVKASS